MVIALIVFLVGAAAGRIRGANILPSDFDARFLCWGGAVALLVGYLTNNFIYSGASLLLAGLGASLGYWGQFDITVAANRNWKNYMMLTLTAMFRFTPLAIAAAFVGGFFQVLPAVLAGVLFVPSYFLGVQVIKVLKFKPLFTEFTCWGEFFFWGSIYEALYLGYFI